MTILPLRRLLIANRGEIAVRIAATARDLSLEVVTVAPEDDVEALHARVGDRAVVLPGRGSAAYLDIEAIVRAGREAGCDAVHPGYGFLSENPAFARGCEAAGMVFVGPSPETLEAFGDKAKARALAERCGVALPAGVQEPVDLEGARRFMAGLEPGAAVILKAVSGGGGRGIRPVGDAADLAEAFERCAAEARSAFGDGALYIERFLPRARHIEVQVLGDGTGDVAHLWERECSLQRRRQKIIEAAPAPNLPAEVRDGMLRDALALAAAVRYRGVGTFEFLAWREGDGRDAYAFIEANPRIQVEHTVTEAITGVDLVALQIRLAAGARLADVGLAGETVAPRGAALQARVNMERMQSDGQARPSGGRITAFEPPSGPGVRVDSYAYVGYRTSPAYDSLLAKVIVHAPDGNHGAAVRKLRRSLARCRIAGVDTNLAFLRAILARPEVEAGEVTTRFIDDNAAELVEASAAFLSVAAVDAAPEDDRAATAAEAHPGEPLAAPLQGTVVSVGPTVGDLVPAGRTVAVLEAMKMEHLVTAPFGGRVTHVAAAPGAMLFEGEALLWLEPDDAAVATSVEAAAHDPDHIRPDLAAVLARRALTRDEGRPEAVARRRGKGRRTARENVAALCDDGSFHEYGSSVVAAQHQRRSLDDLIRNTPADGLVCGIGAVNGDAFGPERSRAVVLAYDETVLAGTQGRQSHRKDCRMFDLARRLKLPVIFFTEGGGGRPGDTERPGEPFSFYLFGRLSGVAPTIGVASGYCFGGNAAFLGCCHITIATQDASIGMGGPAMIEGGGLGVFKASEVGPAPTLYRHGAVDLLVKDEAEAAQAARACLAYFQGAIAPGPCPDQRRLRDLVPEDRRRAYDIRPIIETLADEGSVLELRGGWGQGMITCFARVEGRPIGIVANNPRHLGGAVDGDGAEKAARFVQLCDNFGIPLLMLCDTPGIMVGPEAEKTGIMRRTSRLLVAGANVRVPLLTVIVRKAYGIGMLAMMGAAYKAPIFNVAWPTAEYGGMGLEGAVKLGFRKELEAIENLAERQGFYDAKVAALYEQGKALTKATSFDFDEVIDPAETRSWILNGLYAAGPIDSTPRHPFVSTW